MDRLPTPRGLSGRGGRFWRETTSRYQFRPDEVEVLKEACRTLMMLDVIAAELDSSPLLVPATRGASKPHPLLAEFRQQAALLAKLLKGLKLPDDVAVGDIPRARTRHASHAARARWSRGDAS